MSFESSASELPDPVKPTRGRIEGKQAAIGERFRGEPDLMNVSEQGPEADLAWNTRLAMELVPDPRLTPMQQEVVAQDYGMQSGVLRINTRACLSQYVLQQLGINPRLSERGAARLAPEAVQVVLRNASEVSPWLF